MQRIRILPVLALAMAAAACDERPSGLLAPETDPEVQIQEGLVLTPSGAVFSQEEWRTIETKAPYLLPARRTAETIMRRQKLSTPDGIQASVTGNAAPSVLCHANAYICGQIPALIPGSQITYWNDAQWQSASVAQFAQFDLIYLHDGASNHSGIVSSKNVWGTATTGRLALTGVHFEHCYAGAPGSGPCRVLKASVEWIHAGQGTGLLMATQAYSNGAQVMPSVAPYNGVTFHSNGGGWDHVRITDPGHATMQGSTNASLSNFSQSSHSIFNQIGGFTNVAEICDTPYLTYPNACSGTFRPHFLVTSVGVADQDGDGVADSVDNCPTVGNPNQADANGNGVGDACESAPSVSVSPSSLSVAPGASVTFTATAQDSDHALSQLTFEWRVGGIVQSGATGPTFTASFTSDATVRVTVRDPGLLSGFADAEVKIQTDATPPVISPTVAGTLGANGWYTSNVSVTWSVVDGESAISSQTGCAASSVVGDTNGVTFTCSATSAGGTATESVTIKRDATAPTVTPAVVGTLGLNGWYVSDVSVSFAVQDGLSGIATQAGCAATTVSADTGAASFSCTATDNAGHSASAAVTVKRDVTGPSVSYSGNAGSYTVDQTVNITCTAADALSGVASDSCADVTGSAYDFAIGINSFSASAEDKAGNTGSGSTSFTVRVDAGSLCVLTRSFVTSNGIANSLCAKLRAAAAATERGSTNAARGQLDAFVNEVEAQSGKALSPIQAAVLVRLANLLR